jgi:acyl carrier protein
MPTPDDTSILQMIIDELQKVNDENIPLSEATDITTDLHVDSLAIMELIFVLEEHFDVSIPLNELGDVRTIGQIVQIVESKRMGNVA